MIEIRKIIAMRETIFSELGVAASRPTIRALRMAMIRNPFAGKFVADLKALFGVGAMFGERLMPDLVKLLGGPAVSYGKGAIVGIAGEMERGRACVQPMRGKSMRAAIDGGKAVIGYRSWYSEQHRHHQQTNLSDGTSRSAVLTGRAPRQTVELRLCGRL